MKEDFVPFEIAKKLKEKGFTCQYPFAMYNEDGEFFPLFTSNNSRSVSSILRTYYDFEDFDDKDFIAPTIGQVLGWLLKDKKVVVSIRYREAECGDWDYLIERIRKCRCHSSFDSYQSYEEAEIAGIEYALDNLI